MSQTMLSRVQAYLARRRTLGYQLLKEGRQLMDFGRYADRLGYRGPLTRQLAMDWAIQTREDQGAYRAQRLAVVRVFARHQAALEPRTEIPARHLLGSTYRRRPPHLFTARQLEHLLHQARELPGRLRPRTYWTLLGLLACTGLRISEALALAVRDVDLQQGVLIIRQSKYQHSRIIPLHPTALSPLRRYARYRERKGRKERTVPLWRSTQTWLRQWIKENRLPPDAPLLPNRFGQALSRSGAAWQLHQAIRQASSQTPSLGQRRISLHTFRHTTAMHLLQGGVAPEVIALWLGHESPNTTHLYVEADLNMKRQALAALAPPKARRSKPVGQDVLLQFLENL